MRIPYPAFRHSAFRIPPFRIPHSAIRNPQSAIRNRQGELSLPHLTPIRTNLGIDALCFIQHPA
jgi:hypothetical protein